MTSRNTRKKHDFFNHGRGVDKIGYHDDNLQVDEGSFDQEPDLYQPAISQYSQDSFQEPMSPHYSAFHDVIPKGVTNSQQYDKDIDVGEENALMENPTPPQSPPNFMSKPMSPQNPLPPHPEEKPIDPWSYEPSQLTNPNYTPSPPSYNPHPPHSGQYASSDAPTYVVPPYQNEPSSHHVPLPYHLGIPPHLPAQTSVHHAHPFPHPQAHVLPPSMPNPVQCSQFPPTVGIHMEPGYGGTYLPNPNYYPLKPMDTNGQLGGAMGFPNTSVIAHSSGVSGGREQERTKKTRQQKCSLCSNHGLQIEVKGHKWFCNYRDCPCDRCVITRGRQHHMKEQQKLTRHLQRLQ